MAVSDQGTEALLLERGDVLAATDAALGAAARGDGRLVLVEGEAGAGKTSVLACCRARAEARGLRVLSGRGGVLERALGFGVADQLFEEVVVRASARERKRLLSGSAALAAPLLGLPAPAGATIPPLIDRLQARHGLYWLVSSLAEAGPLAIVVDDAQWCDDETLDWLLYLARRIEALPIALLIGVRLGESHPRRELLDAIASEPVAEVLTLPPLSAAGTAALLAARYGTAVAEDFAAACHAWTGGNPHFVSEITAQLIAEGTAPVGAAVERMRGLAPERISGVTLMRIGRLGTNPVALSRALALLGSGAELRHAATLAGLDERVAVEAADMLVAARVITGDAALRFAHPLVESVVYEDLPPHARAAGHKQAARLLDEQGVDPERVASQLLRADAAGDAWVVDTLRSAAVAAMGRGSASAAVAFLRRAREEPPARDELAAIQVMLGLAESIAGDPAGLASLEAALAASTAPVERAQIALLLGRFLLIAGQSRAAVDALAPAIEGLDESEHDLRLQLEAAFINAAHGNADLREQARTHLERVRGAASEDTHPGRLVALACAYAATAEGESAALAVGYARTALQGDLLLHEAPMSPDVYLIPLSMLALADELDEADARYDEAIAHARAIGSELAYAATACMRAYASHLLGRLPDAELLARDSLRVTGGAPAFAALTGFATAHLALALIDRGELDEARALLRTDLGTLSASPQTWARDQLFAGGRSLLADRRPADALECLLACGERSAAAGIKNPAFLPWRSQAALAAHAVGETERAEALSAEEVRLARRFGARRPLGVALRAQGLIRGGNAGLALLGESAELLRHSAAALERAQSFAALGAALRRAGRRAEARDVLAEALELATECGAGPLAADARAELSAGGARPRAHGSWDPDALTVSELRVCEMAAGGLSNPEIAQALFVTRGTVESHLHVAYRKLGISSRRELGAALQA